MLELAVQLTRIIVPVIILVGVLSNVLNIILLTRRTLIHHACSQYFLALAVTNLFYSSCLLVVNFLADGYQLDPSRHSAVLCKLISYLLNACPSLSVYFLVLASADRYCASSISATRRRFSNVRAARWAICIVTVVLAVFFVGTLIAFDLSSDGMLRCTVRSDLLFNQIFLVLILIVYVFIAPFSMVLFGCLTIYNTTQLRFIPMRISRYRRTERQLSQMLIVQVGVHVLLILPFCVTFFMLILPIQARFTVDFVAAFMIAKLPFYLTVTTAFFLYVLTGTIYRHELLRLAHRLFRISRERLIRGADKRNTILPLGITATRRSLTERSQPSIMPTVN